MTGAFSCLVVCLRSVETAFRDIYLSFYRLLCGLLVVSFYNSFFSSSSSLVISTNSAKRLFIYFRFILNAKDKHFSMNKMNYFYTS